MDRPEEEPALPANYEVELPVRAGVIAGIAGALSIIVVVTTILILSGNDIFAAARLIATVVYGPEGAFGIAPILVGTGIHLVTGGVLGALFARFMPRLPRNIWVVAGLIYGIVAWLGSTFLVLPVVAPPMIAAETNIYVLLLAHVIYGAVLGLAGGTYGLWWHLPAFLQSDESLS